ncbi:MAG TPA: Kazal-type serine protease inhibitor [Rhizomicrobium sp.]|nr:Kazal-type serine protease inhibitor [Rhizomicrobium sp.]
MKHLVAIVAVALFANSAARAEEKPCPRIAKPVCALNDGSRMTYDNMCLAENARAKVLHDGACEGGDMCSMIYMPVCGIDPSSGQEKTYSSICVSEHANAVVTHDGECKAPQN